MSHPVEALRQLAELVAMLDVKPDVEVAPRKLPGRRRHLLERFDNVAGGDQDEAAADDEHGEQNAVDDSPQVWPPARRQK